jgi:hypothetical protein
MKRLTKLNRRLDLRTSKAPYAHLPTDKGKGTVSWYQLRFISFKLIKDKKSIEIMSSVSGQISIYIIGESNLARNGS